MKQLLYIFLLFVTIRVSAQLTVESKQGASGTHYTIFKKNNCRIGFTTSVPSKDDKAIQLCIPAAFTNVSNNQVDGAYAVNGKAGNVKAVNKSLGGVFYMEAGKCRMFQSGKGKLITDSLWKSVAAQKASFFQQIQCIQNGKASSFKDLKVFQRRGIALYKDGSVAVIESNEAITLAVFSTDLAGFGVYDLIYTDMGAWDEGWYRDAKQALVTIGKDRSQTARQSNWVVFKK